MCRIPPIHFGSTALADGTAERSKCEFTMTHYREIVTKARDLGYAIVPVSEGAKLLGTRRRFLMMRHDVDFIVTDAPAIAKADADVGGRSSFMIGLHSDFYSPLQEPANSILREIAALGHEIGLHYDLAAYEQTHFADLRSAVRADLDILERWMGLEITTMSQHRPASNPLFEGVDGVIDAYEKRFILGMYYTSDSSKIFRQGCLCEALGQHEQIHALLHPTNWGGGTISAEEDYKRLEQSINERTRAAVRLQAERTRDLLANRDQRDGIRREAYN